jgi:putative membrane protein
MLEIIFSVCVGIFFGTITGLIPGIHINLVGALVISLLPSISYYMTREMIILFLVSMAITHTFIDFIPSIFFGAPDEDSALSVLPGHQLLKKGYGYYAFLISAYGSLWAIFSIALISPIFLFILPRIENLIKIIVPLALISSSLILIFSEKKKINAVVVFMLSGFLGIGILNSNINQPFLPMLSGLFGASTLIISIKSKTNIPPQKTEKIYLNKRQFIKTGIISSLISPVCCLFPGIGSGQSAVICSSIKKMNKKEFLFLLGSINTIIVGMSFIILYSLGKTRTGIAAVFEEVIFEQNITHLFIIMITIVLTGIICFYYSIFIAKLFAKNISKINYTKISLLVLLIIAALVFIFSGIIGFLFFIVSTSTGIFGILSGVKRTNLMGCLIIPVLLFYII